jgi:hypothetical protein
VKQIGSDDVGIFVFVLPPKIPATVVRDFETLVLPPCMLQSVHHCAKLSGFSPRLS